MPAHPAPLAVASRRPILAFGTSGPWCSVGLRWYRAASIPGIANPDAPSDWQVHSACASEHAGNAHSQRLLPMARELLEQAGLRLDEVGLVAFDAGPGSFTGLRIGCGLAQGLALGLGCPVLPVASLRALAWPHRSDHTLCAADARMGEIYLGEWEPDADIDDPGQMAVVSPDRVGDRIERLGARAADAPDPAAQRSGPRAGSVSASPWIATGDAFARYPQLAQQARAAGAILIDDSFPRADAIAEIAAIAWARGQAIAADEAAPLYLRDKVALDIDEQQAQRALRKDRA